MIGRRATATVGASSRRRGVCVSDVSRSSTCLPSRLDQPLLSTEPNRGGGTT